MKLKYWVYLGLLVGVNSLWISYKDSHYIIGPYGKKDSVNLSEPVFTGDDSTSYSISGFRYRVHHLSGWDNLSDDKKTYINRCMDNHHYGYTFSDGDALVYSIVICYQLGLMPLTLKWPIPRSD